MSDSASIGGSKGESESSTQVDIPDFLRPFLTQATGTASGALRNLQRLSGGQSVADFTPDQQRAFELARDAAGSDLFSTAQQTLRGAAGGTGIDQFLPSASFGALSGAAGGQDISSFIPRSALTALTGATGGGAIPQSVLNTLSSGQLSGLPPEVLNALRGVSGVDSLPGIDRLSAGTHGGLPVGASALSGLDSFTAPDEFSRVLEGEVIPAASRDALSSTARGDFLFGGESFDAAVDAAVRAARPGVISTFGRAGAGGATGGLAQTAIGQAAVDAFASQFGQERGRQLAAADRLAGLDLSAQQQRLGAAGELAGIGLASRGQDIDASSRLSNIDLANRGQQLGAAESIANFGLGGQGQQITAANLLGNLDLANRGQQLSSAGLLGDLGLSQNQQRIGASGLLSDIAGQERGRQLSSAGLLGELANTERGRQLQAAGLLPDLSLFESNVLSDIGGQQQRLAQSQLDSPFMRQLQLLSASLGGLPISSLLGQSTEGSSRSLSFGSEGGK